MYYRAFISFMIILVIAMACSSSSTPAPAIPEVYNRFYGATSKTLDGDFLIIKSAGVPDHKTPYYSVASGFNIPYDGTNINFSPNPAYIANQNISMRIPLNPVMATTHTLTGAGPIGMAANGVLFYNEKADESQSLPLVPTDFNSIDQFNGHTNTTGQYHYHQDPIYLSTSLGIGSEQLLGFMLDGFPLYGPKENGAVVTNAMLDSFHGHTGITQDYQKGIYHYHVTSETPYLIGTAGFYGTPGTITQ